VIKIAKLTTGEMICGQFDKGNWKKWKCVFFIHLTEGEQKQLLVNFIPLMTFGDFDQYVELKEDQFVYSYIADSKFSNLYNEQVTKVRVAKSGLILPNSTNIGGIKS